MKEYSKQIEDALNHGTERSIYKPLCNFLESFIQEKYKKQVSTIAEQSSKNYQKGVGFPDITLKEKDFTIGYIEVKLPNDNLDDKKFKTQFDRYKNSLENIIFTNLKNWQLWQWNKEGASKKVKEIIFDYTDPKPENFVELLDLFLNFTIIQASTPKQLAINLAKKTKLLADLLCDLLPPSPLVSGSLQENSLLIQTKEAFQTALLNDIDDKSFTNLIAETFTYSLFIAALELPNPLDSGNLGNNHNNLTLTTAIDYIPEAIPVLHDLYKLAQDLSRQIPEIKESVELILKELNNCDITKIRNSFYLNENTQKEPTLYFYETFLEEYDKETKKKRGVFYTEKPIVDFIVRSVDELLTQNFGLENGLMNSEVKLLDPATGTGSFLASSIELIKNKIDRKYKTLNLEKDQFIKEVSDHILKNFFGFEFMIAPYTVAHLKLNLLLKSFGFELKNNDRLKIYVANTLDDPAKEPINLFGFSRISEESKKAKEVKNQKDIIAIIGNPPYSGSSQNPSINKNTKKLTWIGEQIESYKYYENQKLDEKNPKWIQDDYVKFIRFAQYQIDSKGSGVIGYIVPHGFLDNPTFRYMRKSLMKSFSEIYILDLHGNNKKKEKAPDGSKDENVFDIEQGVAIVLFVKNITPQQALQPSETADITPRPPCKGEFHRIENKNCPPDAFYETNVLKYNTKLLVFAEEMRKNPTESEKIMWNEFLRANKTNYKFTRQKPIDNFILDFYCAELLLGIEIDGDYHKTDFQQDYDKMRTELLNYYKIEIVRFDNKELNDLSKVKAKLTEIIQAREQSIKSPLPRGLGGNNQLKGNCTVYHGDLYGKREDKLKALREGNFRELCKTKLEPKGEMSYFIPRGEDLEYEKFWSVKDIFRVNGVGITTAHDDFVIGSSREKLIKKFQKFKNSPREAELLHKEFEVKKKEGWDILKGYDNLQQIEDISSLIESIAYRPFDTQYIIYEDKLVWRTVRKVMQHLLPPNPLGRGNSDILGDFSDNTNNKHPLSTSFQGGGGGNLALMITRQVKSSDFQHIFITNSVTESCCVSNKTSEIGYVFPLYLNLPPSPLVRGNSEHECFSSSFQGGGRGNNFTESFKKYKEKHLAGFTNEQIFYYIYGLLHSPNYRTKYNEFLKTDFPRIDFSFDINKVSALGEKLAQLHLLKHPIFEQTEKWNLKVEGNNYLISFARKADLWKDNKIYINENTFIDGVEQEVFEFMIGGYQVLDKWLSDRKNTTLSADELLHYLKIIVSLKQTSQIMNELNEILKNIEEV